MPGPESSTNQCGDKLRSQGKTVALQVLKDGRPAVRPSTKGKWRALVLILVHVVMIAHFVQWWFSDRDDGVRETLAPVEPSETMYALELGQVNMGLVFFSVALLATFLFGRFFCGWGCHIIALQDLCGWAMKKIGVRPKPFRTRLLLWWPLLLALYMFVWPTFRRDILQPAFEAMKTPMPTWLGYTVPFPGFSPHFIVEDFWATFPPWFIAVPFILVCTFGAVYFLGNKGFCSYGCPYGGFFAPMDRFSIGRIVVNDNCEGCGHCTAVCTSNVRVHQEVRDFGMVVDPGCMKCLDCVSVCPNNALSFSFAKPAIAVKPRTDEARAGHLRRPEYDAPLKVEAVLFFLGIAYFVAFRGMLDSIPLLMSAGIAGILTFCTWKEWTLITVPNVRLQSIQLRLRGRFTLAGVLFLALVCASVLTGAWSGYVRYHKWRGEQIDYRVTAEYGTVFTAGYKPDPAQKAMAEKALRHFEIAGPRKGVAGESGIGWRHNAERAVRIAWLYAVTGDLESCEAYLRFANTLAEPTTNSIHTLARVVDLRGGGRAGMIEVFENELLRRPRLDAFAVDLSLLYLEVGNIDKGVAMLRQTLAHDKPPADALSTARATDLLAQVGLRFSRTDFVNEAKSAVAKRWRGSPTRPNCACSRRGWRSSPTTATRAAKNCSCFSARPSRGPGSERSCPRRRPCFRSRRRPATRQMLRWCGPACWKRRNAPPPLCR